MKTKRKFILFYHHYPFNVIDVHPDKTIIEAESMENAITILKSEHGKNKIEIFKSLCKEK